MSCVGDDEGEGKWGSADWHKLSHFVQFCLKMELSKSMQIQSILIVHDLGTEIKAKNLTSS